jgi:hypothetical protein
VGIFLAILNGKVSLLISCTMGGRTWERVLKAPLRRAKCQIIDILIDILHGRYNFPAIPGSTGELEIPQIL